MNEEECTCLECGGRTVEFRGSGLDMQYRICSRFPGPSHLSEEDVRKRIADVRVAVLRAIRSARGA